MGKSIRWTAAGLIGYALIKQAIGARRYMDLRGKTVLITGGSRGLGIVLARQLVHEQARLVICSRNREELSRAYQDLVARGGQVLVRASGHTVEIFAVVRAKMPAKLVLIGDGLRRRLGRETAGSKRRRARRSARRRLRVAEYHIRAQRPSAFFGECARVI